MHAYLIIGGEASAKVKIAELASKLDRVIEFPLQKIADVRELNNFTRLKVTEKTAILIKDFNLANEETQNAFLKALEEPQENLSFILIAKTLENVLPTIVSRCEVIDTGYLILDIKNEEKEKVEGFLNAEIGEKFKQTSQITKRDEALEFIKNIIFISHQTFIHNPRLAYLVENANNTMRNLEANGNVTLQLTNFVIQSHANDRPS